MLFDQETFVGVDPAAGNKPFVWAAINPQLEILALRQGSMDDLKAFILGLPHVSVAINCPCSLSKSLLLNPEIRQMVQPIPRPGRYSRFRVCEYILRIRNIRVIPVPPQFEHFPGWMRNGFQLYHDLKVVQTISSYEVNAHAAFCVLLTRVPFLKNTLEGMIQRQLLLHQKGLQVSDPMNFFEEITRRRILQGVLPGGILKSVRELDALACAYTVYLRDRIPQSAMSIGHEEEGQILLPVSALQEKYH